MRDISFLNQHSKQNIQKYIDEKLPNEYEKCPIGLTAILKEARATSEQALDRRAKIQALALAKDCYTNKLELLTNATVVDDAIRFVAAHTQKNQHKDSNDKLIKEIRNEDIEKEITPATTESLILDYINRNK